MILRFTAYSFIAFIIFMLLSVNLGWNWFFLRWTKFVPFQDKMMHFVFIGLLSFFVNLLLDARRTDFVSTSVLTGSLLIFAITTVEEFSQILLANRNFELLDLLCNVLGILFFGKLAELYVQKSKKPALPKSS